MSANAKLFMLGASASAIFACAERRTPGMVRICLDAGGTGAADVKKLASELKDATDVVKSFADKVNIEIKNLGTVTSETKASADKALTEMNDLKARFDQLDRKVAEGRIGAKAGVETRSIGHQVIENEEVKAALGQGMRFKGRINVEVKTITSASASGTSSTTALVPADRQAGIITQPVRARVVRDLLLPGRTASASIEYVKENVVTNNAAMVAENPGSAKPQSDITYLQTSTSVKTMAHFIKASKQILDDAPMLQSMIDTRLRIGLSLVEDQQLLTGDGTGNNLLGLIPQATAYAKPTGATVANATMIDVIRLAMLQATLALYPSTGIVLHPTDWANIELTKDGQSRYIFANPLGLAGANLWGLPVAESMVMTQGQFLTGALKYAAQIFDREDANVMLSTEDQDNFVKNMVTILAEERLALVVYRPQALITGAVAPS